MTDAAQKASTTPPQKRAPRPNELKVSVRLAYSDKTKPFIEKLYKTAAAMHKVLAEADAAGIRIGADISIYERTEF